MLRFSIFCRKFFVSQCRKYSQVNRSVLCFRKLPVAKKFMDKRGEYQDFSSKIFCLTMLKNFVGESFTVALTSGTEKVWRRGGGGYQDFPSNFFLPHSAEKFRRGILYCCSNFGYRKSLDKREGAGVSRYSVENFLSHSPEIVRK